MYFRFMAEFNRIHRSCQGAIQKNHQSMYAHARISDTCFRNANTELRNKNANSNCTAIQHSKPKFREYDFLVKNREIHTSAASAVSVGQRRKITELSRSRTCIIVLRELPNI